jgi:hypothetical protein
MTRHVPQCALALAALLGAPLSATMVVPADLGELVASANVIAHGHVSVIDVRAVPGRRAVERVVTFQVERYFKGDLGAEIRVRVPGGELGPYRTVMIGAPRFREGDEVVLFLGEQGSALPHILGLSQGLYRVVPGGARGLRVVLPAMAVPASVPGEPVILRRGDRSRRPVPFAEFAATVQRLVAERAAGGEGEGR